MLGIIETLRRYIEKIYHIYQLAWMMDQGLSVSDIFSQLLDEEKTADAVETFEEIGFKGSCYVCLEEFMTHEFNDFKYINGLLEPVANSDTLLRVYNKFFGDFYRELEWEERGFISDIDEVIVDEYHRTNIATLEEIRKTIKPNEISELYRDVGLDITRWVPYK